MLMPGQDIQLLFQVKEQENIIILIDKGELYMFGSAEYGQLGTGRLDKEVYPCKIDLYNKVSAVACGIKHTLILTDKGKVYSCGNNATGELGTGNKRASFIFSKVAFPTEEQIKKVAAGQHSAAVSEKGELYVWGTGSFGEFLQPQKMTGIKNPVVDISVGGGFGCAIDIGGSLFSWGSNKFGELGLGDYDTRLVPTLVSSLQGKRTTAVSCGGNFAMALGITIIHKPDEGSSRGRYGLEFSGKKLEEERERETYSQRDYNIKRESDLRRDRSADNLLRTHEKSVEENRRYSVHRNAFDEDLEALRSEIAKKEKATADSRYDRGYSPYRRSPGRSDTVSRGSTIQKSPRETVVTRQDPTFVNVSFEADKNFFKRRDSRSTTPERYPYGEERQNREVNSDLEQVRRRYEEIKQNSPSRQRRDSGAGYYDRGDRTVSPFRTREDMPPRPENYNEEYRLGRENRILRENLEQLKKQLIVTEKVQLEDAKLRDRALERRYEFLESEHAELQRKFKDMERELNLEREHISSLKRDLEEERAQNERHLKVLEDNRILIDHLENENRRLIERQSKSGSEYLEAEKEREFFRKKYEELQKKFEKQAHDFNEALREREERIERLQNEKDVIITGK